MRCSAVEVNGWETGTEIAWQRTGANKGDLMGERVVEAEGRDGPSDFTGGQLFEHVFAEGMALVEQAAAYLDGPGRTESKKLTREAGLTYASWSMELTTRLMQAASWLVMQKAVRDGDMKSEEALAPKYRMVREAPPLDASAQVSNGLPTRFLELVSESEALYDRICRIDASIYGSKTSGQSPVNLQIERLKAAAETGAFDPLQVWRKLR
jgi:regulator of CtrA degradation